MKKQTRIGIAIVVACTAIMFSTLSFGFYQPPVVQDFNEQTITGCIDPNPFKTGGNFRVIAAPWQNCKEGEIKIQFQVNRVGENIAIGRVFVDGYPGDVYKYSQRITNTYKRTAYRTETINATIEPSTVYLSCETGSPGSDKFYESLLNNSIIPEVRIERLAIGGYGPPIPELRVILQNVQVVHLSRNHGETNTDEVFLSYQTIYWELGWYRYATDDGPIFYQANYNLQTGRGDYPRIPDSVEGFIGGVTNIPDWPNQFLAKYFQPDFVQNSSGTLYSYEIFKSIDPSTIVNLGCLLSGKLINQFEMHADDLFFDYVYQKASVKSVEITFLPGNIFEKVVYEAGGLEFE